MKVYTAVLRTRDEDVDINDLFNLIEETLRKHGHELRSLRQAYSNTSITVMDK